MTEALVVPPKTSDIAPIRLEIAGPWALTTTIAAGTYYDLDPNGTPDARPGDVVIEGVKAGQFVEYGVSIYSGAAANAHYLGPTTIVAGAPVKTIAPLGWMITSNVVATPSGSIYIPIDAADIEDDSVRIRLRGSRIGAGNAARNLGFTGPMALWGRGPFG